MHHSTAASTEIVARLGMAHALVGISHECDWPPSIKKVRPAATGCLACDAIAFSAPMLPLGSLPVSTWIPRWPTGCGRGRSMQVAQQVLQEAQRGPLTQIRAPCYLTDGCRIMAQLPSCSSPNMDPEAPSIQIDTAVREIVKAGRCVYTIDALK